MTKDNGGPKPSERIAQILNEIDPLFSEDAHSVAIKAIVRYLDEQALAQREKSDG